LAGFPFGGVSSFKAMARHIPVGGNCLIVYAPQGTFSFQFILVLYFVFLMYGYIFIE